MTNSCYVEKLEAVAAIAREVAAEHERHILGGESPLYVKLCSLDEALDALTTESAHTRTTPESSSRLSPPTPEGGAKGGR